MKSWFFRDTSEQPLDATEEERFVFQELDWILPDEFNKEPLAYRVVAETERFVSPYCRLSQLYEMQGYRQFSALPLRKSYIFGHIPIDTKILLTNILGQPHLIATMTENKYDVWDSLFRMKTKAFKSRNGYSFDGMLKTDGVSACIYLRKNGTKARQKASRSSKKELLKRVKQNYFEHHVEEIKQHSNVVVIDPNKRDLLYCKDAHGNRSQCNDGKKLGAENIPTW
jgi:hypothetical protein